MKFKVDASALQAINILNDNNYEAYIVGGAVRDFLLNKAPKDYDLVTNATLDDLKQIFIYYKIVEYKKGNTLGIVLDHKYIEISTFNGSNIIEDLSNRDFTINAMAYDTKNDIIIDPANGIIDLSNKVIKSVKNPIEVIEADPLRILRAIRFSASLGFDTNKELKDILNNKCNLLNNISKERIGKELNEILITPNPSIFIREYFDVFCILFPPLRETYKFNQHSKWHHLDVFEHIMCVLDNTKPDIVLRLAALLHDIEKPACFSIDDEGNGHFYDHFKLSADVATRILTDMRYSHEIISRVHNLVYYHDRQLELREKVILNFLKDFGTKDLDLLFNLKKADIKAQNPELLYRLEEMEEIERLTLMLAKDNAKAFSLYKLNINGDHLINIGYAKNDIKNTLMHILDLVIEGKIENNKKALIEYAKSIKK